MPQMAAGQHDEMTCKELVGVLTDYLEGTLPAADRVRLEEHVAECPYCEEYIAQMRQTIEALGELPADSLAPRRQAELLEAFRGWRRT
jgi:anti-sigma factor RsiW